MIVEIEKVKYDARIVKSDGRIDLVLIRKSDKLKQIIYSIDTVIKHGWETPNAFGIHDD